MEKKEEKKAAVKKAKKGTTKKPKYNKTWEAALRLKGIMYVNDPAFLL